MSDYSTEISVTKLIGASAGYIGYEEGGRLTEAVKNKPYNLVLFDEMDLAHPSVFNILYQLLDEGRVVDGKGCEIDFSNCVIIMTSNIGYKSITDQNTQECQKNAEKLAVQKFGPALFNRIDAVVHFNPLGFEVLNDILTYQIKKINERFLDLNINIVVKDSARVKILQECTSSEFGARPLKKYLQRTLVNSISKFLLKKGENKKRGVIEINADGNGTKIGDYCFEYYEI
jgi:ATP-dependent Clp protease ATP-binding subunit ClpB